MCTRLDAWREKIEGQSVSLIFASSYMNNPSSMYGHTFLLLKKETGKSQDLLDYVVNFAADLEGDNGALFAIKGLAGGYSGRFSTFPYYMKVQEYAHLESRDLWEYDLSFSTTGTRRLVEHLWELGGVRIPYFFLNKNCSYYMLPLFEVADRRKAFKDAFLFKTIPVDTVRAVRAVEGESGNVVYRPSHAHLMLNRRARLNSLEMRMAERVAEDPARLNQWPEFAALAPERRALVLESAHDLFRYHVGFAREQPTAVQEKEHTILMARSQLPPADGAGAPVKRPVPPHEGHRTARLRLSHGFSNRSGFQEISLRPAIHDQEDPPQGYLPGSKLEMFHLTLRYDDKRTTLYVKEFSVIDMVSMTPFDRWIHPPSWKVQSGLGVADDLQSDPENSLYYGLHLGSGYSAWLVPEKVLVYGMGEATLQLGSVFKDTVRLGGGPTAGILLTPLSMYRLRFSGSYTPYLTGGTPSTVRISLHQSVSLTKSLDARLKLERANAYKEILLSLAYFF